MRLWSLHPCYLDAKGLVALWREGLLARAVLKKETRGYQHHPQLVRFRQCTNPVNAINQYLRAIYEEATKRGYRFNADKLAGNENRVKIFVAKGQLEYEWMHLQVKLKRRDKVHYKKNRETPTIRPHPLFKVHAGGVALWEKVREQ